MRINSVVNRPFLAVQGGDELSEARSSFQGLGRALASGNLSEGKEALTQLQKHAPAHAARGNDPISKKMDALTTAVDSGDLQSARDAYAEIKKTMSQRPPPGTDRAGGSSTPPPGGPPPGGANKPPSSTDSPNLNKVYDTKDANKDGTVSWQEDQDYHLIHPDKVNGASTTARIASDRGKLDAVA